MTRQQNNILATVIFLTIIAAIIASHYFKRSEQDLSDTTSELSGDLIIGLVDSLTGPEATFGIETLNGLKLVFDDINDQGGIKGRKIRLIALDDQGKPEEAANAARRLVNSDQALAIFGTSSSQRTLVVAPITQSSGTPLIVPGATHPAITKVGDHVFRVCFTDDFQGEFMAKFAVTNLKAKRIATMTDMKSDYSVGLTDWFIKSATSLGATIVARQSYTAGDLEYHSQLTSLRAHKADTIYVPGYYTDVGLIIRQARELHMKASIIGGDGWDSPRLIEIAGKGIENTMFSNHFVVAGNTSPVVAKFSKDYQKRFGRAPGSAAALAFDSALVFRDALIHAKSLSRENINESLKSVKDITGVTGMITMGPDRNAVKQAIVVSVRGGEFIRAF